MTTGKLLLMLIPLTLSVIAVVLGFKSYSIGLKSNIRLKYHSMSWISNREQVIQSEYEQKMRNAVILFVVFSILLGVLAYLVVLVLKNDIPFT